MRKVVRCECQRALKWDHLVHKENRQNLFHRELDERSACYTRLLPLRARINYPPRANHYFGRFCHLFCVERERERGDTFESLRL